ncbi:MAG TPA: hypothetical protein VIX73_32165 [Kofleriaceae bacterium]
MASANELLKQKAMLLLRCEQELYTLGLARDRALAWLRAFHRLSVERAVDGGDALLRSWTLALVEELRFQTAAVYQREPGTCRFVMLASKSRAMIPPSLSLELVDRLIARTNGVRNAPDAPDAPEVEELAQSVGLERFVWVCCADLLVVSGFVADTAPFVAVLSPDDLVYFDMLARHLFVLVRNRRLIDELQRSLAITGATRSELANKVSELEATRERLVQSEKLAVAGELAGSVAHEVNNPLAIVLGGLDSLRDYSSIVDRLWTAAKSAADYLRSRPDPEARDHARQLFVEGSEAETEESIGGVIDTVGDMSGAVQRLATLVKGFRRLASARPVTPEPVELDDLVAEVASTHGGATIAGDRKLVALVPGTELRIALGGVLAFLASPDRKRIGSRPPTLETVVDGDRPCVVVTDPDVVVSTDECGGIFDPRVRVDTRAGRTMRLDLDLALAYQQLLLGGTQITFAHAGDGVIVRFALTAHPELPASLPLIAQ